MSLFDELAGIAPTISEDRDVAASQREIGKAHTSFMGAAKKAIKHVAWSEDHATDFREQIRTADRAMKKALMILANQH